MKKETSRKLGSIALFISIVVINYCIFSLPLVNGATLILGLIMLYIIVFNYRTGNGVVILLIVCLIFDIWYLASYGFISKSYVEPTGVNYEQMLSENKELENYDLPKKYNTIVYNDNTYYVAPLGYSSLSETLLNAGIPGYVLISTQTLEPIFVRVDGNIVYSSSVFALRNELKRHIWVNNLNSSLEGVYFEIDDEGIPFYIVPLNYSDEIFIVNACNGNIVKYNSILQLPDWCDYRPLNKAEIVACIQEVYTIVEKGTTYFYYVLEGYDELFVANIKCNREQVRIKVGDSVSLVYSKKDGYNKVTTIDKVN